MALDDKTETIHEPTLRSPLTRDGGATAPIGHDGAGNSNGNGSANGAPQQQQGDGGNGNNGQPQQGPPQGGGDPQPGQGDQQSQDAAPPKKGFTQSPIFKVLLAVVVLLAIIFGTKFYLNSLNHVSTDDAYVQGDLINVSPIISGTLEKLTVDEGDYVKAGTVIAVLDQSGPRASVQQARAAYLSAQSQVPQAQSALTYETANNTAGVNQAKAAYDAQNAKTAQSAQQARLVAATTASQIVQDQAQANAVLAQGATAKAQANAALQAVQTARNAAAASHQQVNVAQANYTRAQKDADRYTALYGPNGSVAAVTAQQVDQAVATADSNRALLQQAEDQASQADSNVVQTVAMYHAQQANYEAALGQYKAALAQVNIAEANQIQVPVQRLNIANNAAIGAQNFAQLQAAKAGSTNVTLRRQQVATARAQVLQSQAALTNAQVTLDDTTIRAPSNGTIVRKGANVGDALSPGQTIATMTKGDYVWIQANFKETQLQFVRVGQPVTCTVDAYPGKTFYGKVQSVNEASGNTTSLLPADNATGNFTKVVQRIPVKIILYAPKNPTKDQANADDIRNLRQGMSVETDIDVSTARQNGGRGNQNDQNGNIGNVGQNNNNNGQ